MIWESCYWKDPLLKSAEYLRRVRLRDRTSERTYVRIEKELFIGFYSIRKLLDTFKISPSTKNTKLDLTFHPAMRQVDYLNWHHLQENYDLGIRRSEARDLRFLCNQFIHSYVFIVSESDDDRIAGFFVASDRDRNSKCYFVKLNQVLKVFRTVGRDYPSDMRLVRDKGGEWIDYATRT